jgi:hypothetical protein
MIEKSKIKGLKTEKFGTALIVLNSIILFVLLLVWFNEIDYFNFRTYRSDAAEIIALTPTFVSGLSIGLLIQSVGRIMYNTGLTSAINEEIAKKNEITIKKDESNTQWKIR